MSVPVRQSSDLVSVESFLTVTGRGVGRGGALLTSGECTSTVAVFVFFKATLDVALHLLAVRAVSIISGLTCQKLDSPLVNLANILFGNWKIQPSTADTLMTAM